MSKANLNRGFTDADLKGLEWSIESHASGYAEGIEEAAKIAENTPIDNLRSQSHEGLRLSISDAIRSLLPTGVKRKEAQADGGEEGEARHLAGSIRPQKGQ